MTDEEYEIYLEVLSFLRSYGFIMDRDYSSIEMEVLTKHTCVGFWEITLEPEFIHIVVRTHEDEWLWSDVVSFTPENLKAFKRLIRHIHNSSLIWRFYE